MRKQIVAAGAAALLATGLLGACDREDQRDVEEIGRDVEEGIEDVGEEIEEEVDEADTDGKDD